MLESHFLSHLHLLQVIKPQPQKTKTQWRFSGRHTLNTGDESKHMIFGITSEKAQLKHHRLLFLITDMLPHWKTHIKGMLLLTLLLAISEEQNIKYYITVLFMCLIQTVLVSYYLQNAHLKMIEIKA